MWKSFDLSTEKKLKNPIVIVDKNGFIHIINIVIIINIYKIKKERRKYYEIYDRKKYIIRKFI